MADEFMTPKSSDGGPVSTPLSRAAGRMRAVLPDDWRVDVVATGDPAHGGNPIVRAMPATDWFATRISRPSGAEIGWCRSCFA
ncbi:hypothetical protein [Nocardia sp. NPDC002869]|uniref:hypothetical protein n=1 Tax=Nocardia sp. NPDC002869 TaxID=3161032 RepID=UPI00398CE654